MIFCISYYSAQSDCYVLGGGKGFFRWYTASGPDVLHYNEKKTSNYYFYVGIYRELII